MSEPVQVYTACQFVRPHKSPWMFVHKNYLELLFFSQYNYKKRSGDLFCRIDSYCIIHNNEDIIMQEILLLEDDVALGNGIQMALQSDNVKIELCRTLKDAQEMVFERVFDLLILDINLPDGSGLELLTNVRQTSSLPIILLTANDMEMDIVNGLESGADDYITKPFSLAVLRARVNAQLRRKVNSKTAVFEFDEFQFDFVNMEYRKGGNIIDLSKTEQKLLRVLVENRGRTLPRSVLVDKIWTDGAEYVDENALSVTIKRLRDKLEETPSKPTYLKTVYGIGYTWAVK